jgi:hypothetical protein
MVHVDRVLPAKDQSLETVALDTDTVARLSTTAMTAVR